MDPFSAFSLGGALADIVADAKTKEIVYSVHNKSSAKLRFALCSSYFPDDLNRYFSRGGPRLIAAKRTERASISLKAVLTWAFTCSMPRMTHNI